MPNYYDMSGEPAAASAQPTTAADIGPTAAETVGATTTGTGVTQEQDDVQRLHKLPPPFFTGDYSQYEEWLFKLQAYLGLIDRDFDMVLQLAQIAARQIDDADIRAHIRDPTQATKAVDLSRDLHYILISICQGAAATVVRQNRYNANGCETLQDQRSTSTTSPTASWTDHELHQDQSSHPGLLQDHISIFKSELSSWHKLQWWKKIGC